MRFGSHHILLFVCSLAIAGAFLGGVRLLGGGSIWAWVQGVPAPLIAVDPAVFTSGAREGQTIIADFTVRNVTSQPVKLLGANVSCGCMVMMNDFPIDLSPGASKLVQVQLTVGKPNASGKFTKSLNLLVNRAGNVPPLVIEVTVKTA